MKLRVYKKISKDTIRRKLQLINYLLKVLNKTLGYKVVCNVTQNTLVIYINAKNITFLLNFLKNHFKLQFKTLIGLTVVDYPNAIERFEVNYFLLSYKLNYRITVKTNLKDSSAIESVTSIFKGAS